ncbi:MAG TPA: ABC transporter ATP-binding protein [Clostridiaceae bacterium]|nr:ABC transporter ATP-binding protein [Clostridiaceae bacterium]
MLLKVKNIYKSFHIGTHTVDVLKNVSFQVERGKICTLLGPSGSGKSTLLNIIGGIEIPDKGSFYFNETEINGQNEKTLGHYRRKQLGYVFQSYNLIPNLTLKENIESGAYLSDEPLDVNDLLHTLGLWDRQDQLPSQLSGGEQQRTAIGRAVIKNPDLLLCDEPTGALDYKTSREILAMLEKVNQKYGCTMMIVTHNEAIQGMADQIIRLHDGAIRSNENNRNKQKAAAITW